MSRLLVVRHAQSVWNAEGRWQGSADPPLSSTGEQQAGVASKALAALLDTQPVVGPVTSMWSSDLRRARRTAAILAAGIGWPGAPGVVPELREHDVGDWSGLTRPEIAARWPGAIEDWSNGLTEATPGGETRAAFDARVRSGIEGLVGRVGPGLAVVVCHGGVLRSLARWLRLPERPFGHLDGYLLATGEGDLLGHRGDVGLLHPSTLHPSTDGATPDTDRAV